MLDFEKLGAFYLGKRFDPKADATTEELLLYDSKDLTTHAVCVGMTGSGKTGLCVSLLEEAAIDGIPALIIDPKGDLGNLLLTFPQLQPASFKRWVDESEAARKGYTVDAYAAKLADTWRNGLKSWGQGAERIRRLKEAADFTIYTPGSAAGLPLTILRSFKAPAPALMNDTDAVRDRVQAAVSGLLAMLGIEADPIQSREHIFLSNILHRAWQAGRDLDLPQMIREIQSPPFDKLGVFDLESFFPAKDRFSLAMVLNNMLASPGFEAWMEGDPLDIQRLLWTPEGKPRMTILSIAHLSEAERMFFVTILLNEVVAWMRTQPGTSSLRALLYMDEIFGYFPPTANPPSKQPMLTLLKQARAFGLGCVLSTQNPVDLDYKGLSNTGTWFIGRLQTERDKNRVLDGLEGASGTAGQEFDRSKMEQTLAGLGNRVFLMNNVHDDAPVLFQTRWAMSFLRGPLTRTQISELMDKRKAAPPPPAAPAPQGIPYAAPSAAPAKVVEPVPPEPAAAPRPIVAQGVRQAYFAPAREPGPGHRLVYRPALLSNAKLHFANTRAKVDEWHQLHVLSPVPVDGPVIWQEATFSDQPAPGLVKTAPAEGAHAELPASAGKVSNFKSWTSSLKNHFYQNHTLTIWKCAELKELSKPGEPEGDFKVRLREKAREERDRSVEKLRRKFSPRLARLQDRITAAEARVEKEREQLKSSKMKTWLSAGTTLVGALLGRKATSVSTVTRAGSTLKQAGRIGQDKGDVARALEKVELLEQQLEDLEARFQEETDDLKAKYDPESLELTEILVRPRKSDITVPPLVLVWTPWIVGPDGIAEQAY